MTTSLGRFRTLRYLFNRGIDEPSTATVRVVVGSGISPVSENLTASSINSNISDSAIANQEVIVATNELNFIANVTQQAIPTTFAALVLWDEVNSEALAIYAIEDYISNPGAPETNEFKFFFRGSFL